MPSRKVYKLPVCGDEPQYRGAVYANLSTLAKAKEGDERSISRVNRTYINWLINDAEDTLADLQKVWEDIQSADGN